MKQIDEAVKIDGFDAEMQHEFDKVASYFAVFKSRANPNSPRYVTKLNEFQLKFLTLLDKAPTDKAKLQIGALIKEIRVMLLKKADEENAKPKNTILAGGKIKDLTRKKKAAVADAEEWSYANPNNNGGEYFDGDVHVYEAPDDDPEVVAAVEKLKRKGYKVSK